MRGRLLAIMLGVVILAGGVYGTLIIRREKERHFARAAALQDSLTSMRKAIDDFHEHEQRYPRSLQELVPKYLRRIPADPVTGSAATWRVTTEENVQPNHDFTTESAPKTETRIIDVHSGASGKDATDVPFAEY
jgi:general secretion pathway protein G